MDSTKTLCRAVATAVLAGLCACSSGATSGPTPTVLVGAASNSVKNDGTTVLVTATCIAADGSAGTGNVTFSSALGTLNGTAGQVVVAAAGGIASVSFACNSSSDPACAPGSVVLNARWNGAVAAAYLTLTGPAGTGGGGVPDAGSGGTPDAGSGGTGTTPANIISVGSTPSVLGLKGSGIQENGVTTFLVTDAYGLPVPGATVNFAQKAPQLVTLVATSAVTGLDGKVRVPYAAGAEVGVSAVTATLALNSAVAEQSIAVRGARPSANGFYFRCDHASLPVYTTIGEFETMTCTVRLTDRFGNRVGVPTVVRFATEAGAISSSATTKAFDPASPNDPNEGTATVTFTTDTGNGNSPADVAALAATAPGAQWPWDRLAEPSRASGSLTLNPRDQFVTIIAMTRGEEAFEDANHNGTYDPGEVFVDQTDPYIDANDNNTWDAVMPNGLSEVRFCGLGSCATWSSGNGVWDADTVLWEPAWVVFTGVGRAGRIATDGTGTATDFSNGAIVCADYKNSATSATHSPTLAANVFVYDAWLNRPSAGTSVSAGASDATAVTATPFGFGAELETWGSMGMLGFDFDWVRVNKTDNSKPCAQANGDVCIEKLVFRDFDSGFDGSILANNTLVVPTAPASTTGFGCAPGPDQYGSATFHVTVTVTNAHGVISATTLNGLFAKGP